MNPQTKKITSFTCLITGALLFIFSLLICIKTPHTTSSFLGALVPIRGFLFIGSILLCLVGIYLCNFISHKRVINFLFLLPVSLAFIMTIIIPFILGVYYSLTDWNGVTLTQFVGLDNYMNFFKTPEYIYSFLATLLFTLINMLLINMTAFGLSLLVTSKIKGRHIYRAGFFVPNLIGGIVLGYIWQFIFNYVFTAFGNFLHIDAFSKSLLISPKLAIFAIVIVSTWQYAGYIMMIYVTAIQSIPDSILDASKVDGASGYTRLTKIILPMVANSFTICIFLTLVNSFKQFDLNYAITNGGPSMLFMDKAINSTELLALNIYKTAFTRNNMALAQSKAVVFFILLAIVSLLQVYISKKQEVEM